MAVYGTSHGLKGNQMAVYGTGWFLTVEIPYGEDPIGTSYEPHGTNLR